MIMKKITVEEILIATKGELLSGSLENTIEGVSIDSREVKSNEVFFPIIGERHDAHDFIPQAIKRGCTTIMTAKQLTLDLSKESVDIILVEDTTKALQDLAAYYLSLFPVKKIAVTGSTGKTTTKEMLYWIFSEKYKTVRNLGNFNNHIGLPLSVFALDENTQAGIFEMGMSELGEIHLLANLVRPDIGIITNIGSSHLENLGSRENILKAKMEITDFFNEENILIVNDDQELLSRQYTEGNYRLITTGETGKSSFILSNINDLGEDGIEFMLEHQLEAQHYKINIPGRHNAYNAALAIAAAVECGLTQEEAARGLAKMELTDKRLSIKGKNGMKIIDDTYNASPDSMKAAIDVLMSTKGVRRIAILGDMFELGDQSDQYHFEIGKYAGEKGADQVIAVGRAAEHIAKGARTFLDESKVIHYDIKELLINELDRIISSGDVILIKGSRGMAMDKIVKRIMEKE
ncbi:MAG: UDP-N-acetylmuramoyl-tripeptide--D-alanyl-D-alanine ligase [Anaerovoracaceae bacterium]|jgi:UDP-N-acetylmuramoyl-tripeptide--D-alanyl-D-alanine ligase